MLFAQVSAQARREARLSFAVQESGCGLRSNSTIFTPRLNDVMDRGVAASNLRTFSVSAGEAFIQRDLPLDNGPSALKSPFAARLFDTMLQLFGGTSRSYSYLSATSGSTLVACRAGIQQASS